LTASGLPFAFAVAIATAVLLFPLCFGSTPARAGGYHSCTTQKLENQGILNLSASHAKCRLARQVAYARKRGDRTPKGFSGASTCIGCGSNISFSYVRQRQRVKFSLRV